MKKLMALFLTLLLLISLVACGGKPTDSGLTHTDTNSDYAKTVTVSTIAELASAIGNDTRIILKEGRYNFSELQNEAWENNNLEVDPYSNNNMLVYRISGVSNLAIEAESGAEVEIVTEVAYSPTLYFEYCSDINVKGLLCGHAVEPGYCTGGVIQADRSKNINIEDCRLYGCGTYGVETFDSTIINIIDTQIYECTYGIMNFSGTSYIKVQGCQCYDNQGYNMLSFYNCWDVLVEDCSMHDNSSLDYASFLSYDDNSMDLRFVNCEFAKNYPEIEMVDSEYVSFKNCTVSPSAKGEHIGYASISDVYENGDVLLAINEVVWIDPSDEALMNQYGISYEDMTNDYAIIDENKTSALYRTLKDKTSFSILTPDPTHGVPVSTEVSGDEFVDAMNLAETQEMLVTYTLDEWEDPDGHVLASITQRYVP